MLFLDGPGPSSYHFSSNSHAISQFSVVNSMDSTLASFSEVTKYWQTFVCLEYLHWYKSSIGMFLRTVHSSNVGSFTTGNLTLDSELLTPLASAMLRISSVCCLNNLVSMSLLLLDVCDSLCCRLNFCMSSPCCYTRANISLPIDERDSACWIDAFVHRFSLIFISKYLSLNAVLSSTLRSLARFPMLFISCFESLSEFLRVLRCTLSPLLGLLEWCSSA